jgi:uncharacterized membrane protein (GlpM family)
MIISYWAQKNNRRTDDLDIAVLIGLESMIEYFSLCGLARVFFK